MIVTAAASSPSAATSKAAVAPMSPSAAWAIHQAGLPGPGAWADHGRRGEQRAARQAARRGHRRDLDANDEAGADDRRGDLRDEPRALRPDEAKHGRGQRHRDSRRRHAHRDDDDIGRQQPGADEECGDIHHRADQQAPPSRRWRGRWRRCGSPAAAARPAPARRGSSRDRRVRKSCGSRSPSPARAGASRRAGRRPESATRNGVSGWRISASDGARIA